MEASARSLAFKRLKPVCVALGKITIAERLPEPDKLLIAIHDVQRELQQVQYFDVELANYVFFPLARIFGATATINATALDVSLRCLRILIERGWSGSTDASLCKQLLILLSFITDPAGMRGREQPHFSDVVTVSALQCFRTLFQDASMLVLALVRMEKENPASVFGQTTNSILVTLKDDLGLDVETSATEAIRSLTECFRNESMLSNFLPGIVSALTRYAIPRGGARRPAKSLINAIRALQVTIHSAFADLKNTGEDSTRSTELQKWQGEQIPQLKTALIQLAKLRDHDGEHVRAALHEFCLELLRTCQKTLHDLVGLLLSTGLSICAQEDALFNNQLIDDLKPLVAAHQRLQDELIRLLQEWLNAFPRVTFETDVDKLKRLGALLAVAYRIANYSEGNSNELNGMIFQSLQQSVLTALNESSATSSIEDVGEPPSKAMTLSLLQDEISEFKTLGNTLKGRGALLTTLQTIFYNFITDCHFLDVVYQNLVLSSTSMEDSVANLWLGRCILLQRASTRGNISRYITGFEEDADQNMEQVDLIYSHAVEVLTSFNESTRENWLIQAISLEIVASMAQEQGSSFQQELVDVLFPVIERMGSPHVEVRERALTCLNVLASSCAATSAGNLIVQNADYLVNAIALKLNAFEISAQAPRVMVMVIHLCGPSIIPYLDDMLESIFAALSSYHGYPRLVDALFAILEAIVDQGSSASSRLLELPQVSHRAEKSQRIEILQVREDIAKYKGLRTGDSRTSRIDLSDPAEASDETLKGKDKEKDKDREEYELAHEEKKEPSKTYQMVQSVARHSQYYLTHASPGLRQRLLKLLTTASIALARNEDQYLPLVNDVWPVVVARLYDPEARVVMESLESLVAIFQSAGDFMLSRVQSEWPRIIVLGRQIKGRADAENAGRGGRGAFSATYQLLEGFIAMLHGLALYIGATAEMEDDIFGLLGSSAKRPSVRSLLELVNDDSLWLLDARSTASSTLLEGSKSRAEGVVSKDPAL